MVDESEDWVRIYNKLRKELEKTTSSVEDLNKILHRAMKPYEDRVKMEQKHTFKLKQLVEVDIVLLKLKQSIAAQHRKEMHERQDDYFRGIRRNMNLRKSNQDFGESINLLAGQMFSWAPLLGKGFTSMLKTMRGSANYNEEIMAKGIDAQKKFHAWKSDPTKEKKDAHLQAMQEIRDYLASPSGVLARINVHNKSMADRLQNAGAYFNKHKAGIMFGVGAFIGLIAIFKKALEVSPMFQQMLKLLNFGIMMVLRPIGDFFGFFMRPILVALLRYFVLPWFRVAYPFYRKWGDTLGKIFTGEAGIETVAALAWESLNTGIGQLAAIIGIGGTAGLIYLLKKLSGAITIAKNIINPPAVIPKVPTPPASGTLPSSSTARVVSGTSGNAVKGFINQGNYNSAVKVGTGSGTAATGGGSAKDIDLAKAENLQSKLRKAYSTVKSPAGMKAFLSANRATITRLASVAGRLGLKGLIVLEPIRAILGGIMSTWKGMDPDSFNAFQDATGGQDPNSVVGILKMASGFGGYGMGAPESWSTAGGKLTPEGFSAHSFKGQPDVPAWQQNKLSAGDEAAALAKSLMGEAHGWGVDTTMAGGGIINEPIFGVGKSGRTYAFGENGSETVIPHGGAAGGVTINIQNMSGSHSDLENLRRIIMQVIQETNVGRGRI